MKTMSVILVVEPDSRHAAQVAAMARRHLTSELVIADSADRAVAAMADRVPDVLLMSSLLSRQDEATLAAWLRDLGPAAAHVQELTIPILTAASRPVAKRRGMLSGLRKDRDDSAATEGCGLDEFARQVSAYVGFAYAHRGIAEPVAEPPAPFQVETLSLPPEPEIVPIKTRALESISIGDDDGWVPIALDGAWEEPASPRHLWASIPAADSKELLAEAAPEPVAIAAPEPESLAVGAQTPVAIAAPAPHAPKATRKRNSRRRRAKPTQDDWGLFDPDQCGFAALVAKLDEITENNHAEEASADASVNLVAS